MSRESQTSSPTSQYNTNWLIGREGDVWIHGNTRQPIRFSLGDQRDSYFRILNLPPIKSIVDIMSNSIIMITREQTLLMFTPDYPTGQIILNIAEGFRLRHKLYNILVYLTTSGELRVLSYRYNENSPLTVDNFTNSTLMITDILAIHPMRLLAESLYEGTLDSVCIQHKNSDVRILSLIGQQLNNTYQSNMNLVAVHFNSLVAENYIIHLILSINNELKATGSSFNMKMSDANYIDSISISQQLLIISENRVMNEKGEVLMNDVSRFVDFLKVRRGCVIVGTDEKTYHLMLGRTKVTNRIIDLNIPIVL